jgi:hypothetical protein
LRKLAPLGGHCAYLNPNTKAVFFSFSDSDSDNFQETGRVWKRELKVPGVSEVIAADGPEMQPPKDGGPWVMLKASAVEVRDLVRPFATAYGLVPGKILGADSSPLVNTLAGAALTGATGYGLGWLGEHVLPDKYFEKGKLRRTLGLLGAGVGAIPGVLQAVDNTVQGRNPVAPWPPPSPTTDVDPVLTKANAALAELFDDDKAAEDDGPQAEAGALDHAPVIERDHFNRVLWSDPMTPVPDRAAAVGLVEAAGLARGDSPLISPYDVARIAVGAGSGYVSGLIVGRTLGALAGLRPETQESLQRAGTWAGIIKGIVPAVLGG